MKKRTTRAISLLLASGIVVAGCSSGYQKTQRASYRTLQDCQAQWGAEETRCRAEGGSVYGPHYIYTGGRAVFFPYMRNGGVSTEPVDAPRTVSFSPRGEVIGRGVQGVSRTSVVRGGFGHSSRGGAGHGGTAA